MRRQLNTYKRLDDRRYALTIHGKAGMTCIFDAGIYDTVKLYKWSHRGKGVIYNEFAETFGSVLAFLYGFDSDDWTRRDATDDYTIENFAARSEIPIKNAMPPGEALRIGKERWMTRAFDPMGIPMHERVRYTNKYSYRDVTVARFDIAGVITITINDYLIQYVPIKLGMANGKVICKDGTRLTVHIQECLDASINTKKYWSHVNISNPFDLRVDPNDNTFISRNIDRIRYHFITDDNEESDERYVVVEVRDHAHNTQFKWLPDIDAKWRLPYGYTVNKPRVAYVVVDEDVYERIDDIFYNDLRDEWFVRDAASDVVTATGLIKPMQLKRLVASMSGLRIDNVYVAPELNPRYSKAMDCTADLSTAEGRRAARIRARYENHASAEGGHAMFKPPKSVKRRHVVADKQYFCTSIYGGVGVWCFDMRKKSVRLRGITSPEQDNALKLVSESSS